MSRNGIDVSHYNEPTNWDLIKGQIDFAILKLGNIGDNNKFWLDDVFEENYAECKRLGIPVGCYVYCYSNEVENARQGGEQARIYLNDKDLDLPVYIDMEDEEIKGEGRDTLTEIVKAFNNEIEKGGKWAGVYANLDWWNNYLIRDELIPRYTSWIAHIDYTDNQDKYAGQYDMFQYSWKGHINGCNGNNGEVDMNRMYRDLISEIKGDKPQPQPEPTPAPSLTYKLGDRVVVSSYYASSTAPIEEAVIKNATGTITKVLNNGCHNPYLLENGDIGWCNDGDIRGYADQNSYYPACSKNETSIVDGLKSIGVDSSFENRKNIANVNGVHDYTGTSTQNNQLLAKLKAGKLKTP